MPTTLSEFAEKVQDQVIDAVRGSQEVVVDSVRSLTDTFERVLPEPARQRLAANLPVAGEAVNTAFGFAGRVLETQQGFITKVIEAATPKATKVTSPAPKATAKTTKTTAA